MGACRSVIMALLAALCSALLLSGCNTTDSTLFARGIGTELYSDTLQQQTAELDTYVANICEQAGFGAIGDAGAPQCSMSSAGSTSWMLFVQAGMNDIDRRCDAYLDWLDNRRRAAAPILHEIGDTQTGVEAGMTAASVAQPAILIVAAAFGFARNSFTNLNSRLLLEVDHSTVQAVVLTRQKAFRDGLPRVIDNRPAAIFALRSYLRICMPFTIETEINNTITLFERGSGRPNPLISAENRQAQILRRPDTPLPPPIKLKPVIPDPTIPEAERIGEFEQTMTQHRIQVLQGVACITPADGHFTVHTRDALLDFLNRRGIKDKDHPNMITLNDANSIIAEKSNPNRC